MRRWGALLGVPLLVLVPVLAVALQAPARYTAPMLAEASFDERVRVAIRTQVGGATRLETVGREARWQVRARPGADGQVVLEAWYDSLAVWRDGPEGRLVPDTDGLVGGRYRGTLTPEGLVTLTTRPFIPEDLAEVTDLGDALITFLPAVPGAALAPGESRADGRGGRIMRRADSTGADGPLARFRWSRAAVDTLVQGGGDTLTWEVRSAVREEGHLVWHPRRGPLAWHREVVTDLEIPADGDVRRPVRSRVEERLQGWRRRAPE